MRPSEFYITFDERWSVYSPGMEVTGTVHLRTSEPMNCDSITVQLCGSARVFWHQRELIPRRLPEDVEDELPLGTFYPQNNKKATQKQLDKERKKQENAIKKAVKKATKVSKAPQPVDYRVVPYANDKIYIDERQTVWEADSSGRNPVQEESIHEFTRRIGTYRLAMSVEAKVQQQQAIQDRSYIPIGEHQYPFKFTLPANCPSSFDDTTNQVASIRYCVKAACNVRPWHMSKHSCKEHFSVVKPFDLNRLQIVRNTVTVHDSMRSATDGGKVGVTLKMSKCAFIPTEQVNVEVTIDNQWNKSLKHISLQLVQNIECHGWSDITGNSKKKTQHTVVQSMLPHKLKKHCGLFEWCPIMYVPAVTPTMIDQPDLISITYNLVLTISSHIRDVQLIHITTPVVIGTVAVLANGDHLVPTGDLISMAENNAMLLPPPTYDAAEKHAHNGEAPPAYDLTPSCSSSSMIRDGALSPPNYLD